MNNTQHPIAKEKDDSTLLSYCIGFVLSIMLTISAYFSVVNQTMAGWIIVAVIVGLAVAQFLVQLVFFLHIGRESKPRWNLLVFSFMLLSLAIIVLGSLWIMHNLDYNMMPREDMDRYMMQQSGVGGI